MPIKDLTTVANVTPTFSLVLRKGGEQRPHSTKPGKMIMGVDLKYFRPDPVENVPNRDGLLADFTALYGETPGDPEHPIACFLGSMNPDISFMAFQEEWRGGRLVDAYQGMPHRCDGEFLWSFNKGTGLYEKTEYACPYNQTFEGWRERPTDNNGKSLGCKPVGRLTLILPDLFQAGHNGYVRVLTNSLWDIANIAKIIAHLEQNFGVTYGVPLYLRRIERPITYRDGNTIKKMTKSLIDLYVDPEWQAARFAERFGGKALPPPPPEINVSSEVVITEDGQAVDKVTGEIVDDMVDVATANDEAEREADPKLPMAISKVRALQESAESLGISVGDLVQEPITSVVQATEIYKDVSKTVIAWAKANIEHAIDPMPRGKDGMLWIAWIMAAKSDGEEVPL